MYNALGEGQGRLEEDLPGAAGQEQGEKEKADHDDATAEQPT